VQPFSKQFPQVLSPRHNFLMIDEFEYNDVPSTLNLSLLVRFELGFVSGRRPDTTRIWNFKDSFRTFLGDCVTSWPGAFKNAGFISTGMGKVYHVRADLCLSQLCVAPACS
jgi:hypothetical protein